MSYGPYDPWDETETYSTGDRVTYGDYIYEAMTSIAAGDNPRLATYSETFVDTIGTEPNADLTMRKWRVWDLPATYIMARLRGVPENAFADEPGVVSEMPVEVRIVQVRADYKYNGSPNADLYLQPVSSSYSGYGMPAGMDAEWGTPVNGELVWSFSAARYQDGKPFAYSYNLGAAEGIIYSPTTVLANLDYVPVDDLYNLYPAWSTETQGQMISCYQTFDREFNVLINGSPNSEVTPPLRDNWRSFTVGFIDDGIVTGVVDDYPDT